MANIKRSKEEVLDTAARLVAGTINPTAMGLSPEQVNVEQFIALFKEAASTLLDYKGLLLIAIGFYAHSDPGLYSNDMTLILESIEAATGIEFAFYNGLIICFSENELCVGWLPQ